MAIQLDQELRNADWTKKSWDLPRDPDKFLAVIAEWPLSLPEFMKLPAARAMPDSLRQALKERGLL